MTQDRNNEAQTVEVTLRDLEQFEAMMARRDPEDCLEWEEYEDKLIHSRLTLAHWQAMQYEASINSKPQLNAPKHPKITEITEIFSVEQLCGRLFEIQSRIGY